MSRFKPARPLLALCRLMTLGALGCALSTQARPVTVEVLEADPETRTAVVREEGAAAEETLTVRMGTGDAKVDWSGHTVTAELVGSAGSLFLERIRPADPVKVRQAAQINRLLRRNTVSRGRQVFRMVGEYMPPFALFNQDGDLITHEHLKGHYTVLNFVFTRCQVPEMCPAATTRMVRLQNQAEEEGLADTLRQVTITFDPDYDTPGILRAYGDARGIDHGRFHLLTGDPQAIRDLCKQFGILVKPTDNTLDHTMATVLLDPNGKIRYRVSGSRWSTTEFIAQVEAMAR